MRGNRKKTEKYRFNGNPFFNPGSIHSVTISDLAAQITKAEKQLADPDAPDDQRWIARWLKRMQKELAKKREGLALKRHERRKHQRATRNQAAK
jgi:hypothetical protein